ncbi:MAG: YihY/virulence factor BrkB family protein [Firmicutes bacterium]|nr:YihY/virulence factor BrkB family protein [Bacillota bacterium]
MKNFLNFIKMFIKKFNEDNVLGLSNELTYKIMLSSFPFLAFFLSFLGVVNLKIDKLVSEFSSVIPNKLLNIFHIFMKEVLDQKNFSIMSISLLISIYSASSGFRSIIKGVNRAYEQKGKRNFIVKNFVSVGLVFLFALAVISSLILSISSEFIINILGNFEILGFRFGFAFKILKYIMLFVILFFTVTLIYKFSCYKKLKVKDTIPGALFTVLLWLISSKLYTIYVENFTNYSKIYGAIAGIFILLIWLNMISILILVGCEINALIDKNKLL